MPSGNRKRKSNFCGNTVQRVGGGGKQEPTKLNTKGVRAGLQVSNSRIHFSRVVRVDRRGVFNIKFLTFTVYGSYLNGEF
jgi:hypothetical protein